jgi:hypothetical protein
MIDGCHPSNVDEIVNGDVGGAGFVQGMGAKFAGMGVFR